MVLLFGGAAAALVVRKRLGRKKLAETVEA
jgi:hypothetical protein